jgi:uncharacterized protein (DUF305 family)
MHRDAMYVLMYAMVNASGAILMCGKGDVRDPQVRKLCANIISSQQSEIDQMKSMLRDTRG